MVKHILIECRTFSVIRKRFFKVNNLTGLFENIKIDDILSFLRETELYQKIWQLWRQIKIKRSPDEQPFKSVWELVHLNIISKRGVYFFRTCEDRAVWHLIPRRISPCSESFLGYIHELAYYVGVNLGLDWPPLARGFQISHYTCTHQATSSSTPRFMEDMDL